MLPPMTNAIAESPLRRARHAAGLSQVDVAERMGIEQSRISSWELDKRGPSLHNAIKLARVLGVTVEQVWGREVE